MIPLSHDKPPIWERIKEVLKVSWESGVYMTYGDTVYSKSPMYPEIEVHESVHIAQQLKIGKDEWWDKYLSDKEFRLEQEAEAYKVHVKWIIENSPRNYRRFRLNKIIQDLSGGTYGNMISFIEAKKLLGL